MSVLSGPDIPTRRDVVEDADVCVVGSGAGGAVVAKELAEAGRSVVVLEAGAHHGPGEFNGREAEMIPRLFEESGLRATHDQSILIYQGRGVGGSTVHNLCYMVRPPEPVLEKWRREFGLHGLTYSALEPSVLRVEQNLKVKQALPYEVNALNRKVQEGCEALGFHGVVQRHNREPCPDCSAACLLGCPYGAKQSMLVTYVPQALEKGARLYARCRALRVETDGRRATGVQGVFLDEQDRPTHRIRVRARAVVLAAGAINTPQLLLNSGIVGRGSHVGRNLHLHPSAFVAGIFDEELHAYRGIPQSYYVDHFLDLERDPDSGFLLMPIFAPPVLFALTSFSFGLTHWKAMQDYARTAAMLALVHDQSTGQVTVDRQGRPVVRYNLCEADKRLLAEGMTRCAEVLFAAGARQVTVPYTEPLTIDRGGDLSAIVRRGVRQGDVLLASSHPQGTCRMGADPRTSVVDEFGEAHHVRGLFVCDASLFPSSIGVPPTVTIASLADRAAHYISESWARYAPPW